MGKIHVLDTLVQNQIAAGEVIERPYSVVKELIENSIDSGATHIVVSITDGGMEKISIRDNGSGMSKEDAILSVERYATSKITSGADLFALHSYGFRGEALASIASISSTTIQTKREQDVVGTEVRMMGRDFLDTDVVGIPDGTHVLVEHLFFNVPARKKYIKSWATEFGYIQKVVQSFAIACPHVSFTLEHNDKRVFQVQVETRDERLINVLGKSTFETFSPVQFDGIELQIQGYILKPHALGASRKHQYLYVNNRHVKSDLIHKAVTEGYHRVSKESAKMQYILFITIDPSKIDVNVHPRKAEVKWAEPDTIFRTITTMVSSTLAKADLIQPISHLDLPLRSAEKSPLPPKVQGYTPNYTSGAKSPYAPSRSQTAVAMNFTETLLASVPKTSVAILPEKKASSYTFLGQLHSCYLLCEHSSGLVVIDQHAAHERVRFEKLRSQKNDVHTQHMLAPLVLHLSLSEQATLEEKRSFLMEQGFIFEDVGDGTVLLSGIPTMLHTSKNSAYEEIFLDMIHDFAHAPEGCTGHSHELSNLQERAWAFTACRGAVQFGDNLTKDEAEALLLDFEQCTNKHTCPHGRTSIVQMDMHTLKSFFDR